MKSMKKGLKLTAVLALVGMGGISLSSCTGTGTSSSEKPSVDPSSETVSSSQSTAVTPTVNGIGTALPFGTHIQSEPTSAADLKADMGVLPIKNMDGSYDLRFIAAATAAGYNSFLGGSFTRAAYTNSDGKTVDARIANAEYVYTEIDGAASVKWADSLSTDYVAYFVYSIHNIPESDVFTTFTLTFTPTLLSGATAVSATQTANYQGVVGDVTKGVTYIAFADDTITVKGTNFPAALLQAQSNAYGFKRVNTAITEAVVSPYVMDIAGFVATKKGTVLYAANDGGISTGCFDSCSSLASITLPDTIVYLGTYFLYNTSALKTFTIPADVVAMESSSFNSDAVTTLNYRARALTLSSSFGSMGVAPSVVNVSKDVISLPDKFFPTSSFPAKIMYEGTTAQYNALQSNSNAGNGFFIDNVICSDTKLLTVNFHVNGGSLTIGGTVVADPYSVQIISGKTVANPGKATYTGKLFDAWYSDVALTSVFDFTTALTVDDGQQTKIVDIYAGYKDYPAGSTIDAPYVLSLAGVAVHFDATADVPAYYFAYTAPTGATADRYYFTVSNGKLNSKDSQDPAISVYDADKTTKESINVSYDPTSTNKAFGDDSKEVSVAMKAGDTYYFKVEKYYSAVSGTDIFGFDVTLSTKTGDTESEATAYVFGTTQNSNIVEDGSSFFTFTSSATGNYLLKGTKTSHFYSFTFMLYHFDSTSGAAVLDGSLSSSMLSAVVSLTSGTQYYLYGTSSNSSTTETDYLTFALIDLPAGSIASNAEPLTVGADAVTVAMNGMQYHYYSLTPTATSQYSFLAKGGSTSGKKKISVFTGTDISATALVTGTESTAHSDFALDAALTSGQLYTIQVGYSSTSYTDSFTLQAIKLAEGSKITYPISLPDLMSNALAPTLLALTPGGTWYTFTTNATDQNGIMQILISGTAGTVVTQLWTSTTASKPDTIGTTMLTAFTGTSPKQYWLFVSDTAVEPGILEILPPDDTSIGDLSSLALGTSLAPKTLPTDSGRAVFRMTTGTGTGYNTQFAFTVSSGTATFDYALTTAGLTAGFTGTGVTVGTTASDAGTISKNLSAHSSYCLVLQNLVLSDSNAILSVTISGVAIPPDGTTRVLALPFTPAADGTIMVSGTSSTTTWYSYACTTSGTYRFWSNTTTGDPYIYGIYAGIDATDYIAGTRQNDASSWSGGSTDYTGFVNRSGWDYYVEAALTAGTTYYFQVGITAGTMGVLLKA
jgi:hypothetical protein